MEAFSAEAVADQLGLPRQQVFKTLCARSNTGTCIFAVVPGGSELDLKKLARVSGYKKIELVPVREVEGLTGYTRGSVTVMAAKKRFQVFVDDSVHDWESIAVSAGMQGLQVMLPADDYVAVTAASVAAIARPSPGS
jgi:Cys-tRNA(Pro)/Cys-tRNA(Cys) deacylase